MTTGTFKRAWIEGERELLAEGEIGGKYGIWPLAWLGMAIQGHDKVVTPEILREMLAKTLQQIVAAGNQAVSA